MGKNHQQQDSLFGGHHESDKKAKGPLASQMRPAEQDQYVGFDRLIKRYPFLSNQNLLSFIVFGPPGSGKTTLAKVLSKRENHKFYEFSAVLSGVPELRKVIAEIKEEKSLYQREAILFIDEIHRFNKAQQDALLPYVENGDFILIGATTENPRASVNRALLSRLHLVELKSFNDESLNHIIDQAIKKIDIDINNEEKSIIIDLCGGDARKCLNGLELLKNLKSKNHYSFSNFKESLLENARNYDSDKDRHYDVISAFIKSIRGSDPDSALLWLAVMLDGGEDPVFIARRLVILASEDIGNADINALTLANSALNVVSNIGMPEARITLSQVTTYLASTVKSNAAYMAINEALEFVRSNKTCEVPEHLKNFPDRNHSVKYEYPHPHPGAFVDQPYSPDYSPQFYFPKEVGVEAKIKERLKSLWKSKKDY